LSDATYQGDGRLGIMDNIAVSRQTGSVKAPFKALGLAQKQLHRLGEIV
jgi:hypothetical protein